MDLLLEKAGSRRFYARGEASVTEGKPMLEAAPWAQEMWKAAAEAKVDAPMVAWNETWKTRKTVVHTKVTEWDAAKLTASAGPSPRRPPCSRSSRSAYADFGASRALLRTACSFLSLGIQ